MSTPERLQFEFEGSTLSFPYAEVASFLSPFTGRALRRGETEITVSPQAAASARELLASSPLSDIDGSLWLGTLDTESYTSDGPHNLVISWSESEALYADSVEFEGLSLTPAVERYEERVNEGGSIVVNFQATLTADETEQLESLVAGNRSGVRYWPVVRRGVSGEPKSMRFGRVIWQKLEDGRFGYDITLVEQAFDSTDESNALLGLGGEPQVGNLVDQVSILMVRFEALLSELEAAGTIEPEGLERIRASAVNQSANLSHIFFEVSDISKW